MKKLTTILLILIIYSLSFNTDKCKCQWIYQENVLKNNIPQTAKETIIINEYLDKGWLFTKNSKNENYRLYFNIPTDSIKSNGQDSNKIKSVAPVIINDTIKNTGQDSNITKSKNYLIKTDTVKIITREPYAKNSLTFQPIGLFLLFTNFEYDRTVTKSFSLGGKVTFTSFLLRSVLENTQKKEKDKKPISTLSSFGMGLNLRYYPGNRAVEGFFLGGAIEGLAIKFDEIKENKNFNPITNTTDTVTTINHRKITLTRIEFEIGSRTKVSSGTEGFVIQWTLAAGVGYWNDGQKQGAIPLGSIGFGIGYAF